MEEALVRANATDYGLAAGPRRPNPPPPPPPRTQTHTNHHLIPRMQARTHEHEHPGPTRGGGGGGGGGEHFRPRLPSTTKCARKPARFTLNVCSHPPTKPSSTLPSASFTVTAWHGVFYVGLCTPSHFTHVDHLPLQLVLNMCMQLTGKVLSGAHLLLAPMPWCTLLGLSSCQVQSFSPYLVLGVFEDGVLHRLKDLPPMHRACNCTYHHWIVAIDPT